MGIKTIKTTGLDLKEGMGSATGVELPGLNETECVRVGIRVHGVGHAGICKEDKSRKCLERRCFVR